MANARVSFSSEDELRAAVLQEKAKGTPDLEIGQKYGVTYRYIERAITRSQGINVSAFGIPKKIKSLHPKDFKEEETTVWSFRQRGRWATHSGEYRGNWSPYIPRNVLLKYSKPRELVLDYFCGAGTTAVEAKLLCRRCIALDINDKAIELAKRNVDFMIEPERQPLFVCEGGGAEIHEPELYVGDARDLSFLPDSSVDLICSHPPYANIIHYTDSKEGDLSFFDIDDFLSEMAKVAQESYRVLKPGRQCAILIGDTRRKKHVIPLGFKLMNIYLDAGFKLRDLVIKRQHNCKTTGFWYASSVKYNFLLLAHEYLPIFEKPKSIVDSRVEEENVAYSVLVPILERPHVKRKLDALETTTVWVLPEKDFEKCLNKNVIERYSNDGGYSTITFTSHSESDACLTKDKKGLLFIKAPFLADNPSWAEVECYLQKMKQIVTYELPKVADGGFVVIQTQDVRIDGYMEPLAKRMVDAIISASLWLKEIVVITQEKGKLDNIAFGNEGCLRITHQYLLIYKKVC